MSHVYHFTDTARLPWIMAALELRPGANRVGGYPEPEFVWATTDALEARTASYGRREYREGMVRRLRFTLNAADFVPWGEVGARYPAWTPEQIARLEASALRMNDDPSSWWCRAAPLPFGRDVRIDTRSYTNQTWTPWREQVLVVDPTHNALGVVIGGKTFLSWKVTSVGATGYAAQVLEMQDDVVRHVLRRPPDGVCDRRIIVTAGDPGKPGDWRTMAPRFVDEIEQHKASHSQRKANRTTPE